MSSSVPHFKNIAPKLFPIVIIMFPMLNNIEVVIPLLLINPNKYDPALSRKPIPFMLIGNIDIIPITGIIKYISINDIFNPRYKTIK